MGETPLTERAADLMSCRQPTLSPNDSMAHAATLMIERKLTEIAVVDNAGRLIGVLRRDALKDAAGGTVASAMAGAELIVGPETGSFDAISLMLEAGLDHLPVVDDGRLVGVISRQSVIRSFADG